MAFTDVLKIEVSGGQSDSQQISSSGSSRQSLSETIADGSTNQAVAFTLDVSAVKSFYLNSSKDITFKTNSSGSPADTLALKANVPYIWHTNAYDTFLLGTDVTVLYITNASGAAATLTIEVITDPTP